MEKKFVLKEMYADLYLQSLILILFYQEHGVGIVNASPISMGLLSNRGPPSWHPAGQCVRNRCKQAADYCQVCFQINEHIYTVLTGLTATLIKFSIPIFLHFHIQQVFPSYLGKFQSIRNIRTHVFWTFISENLRPPLIFLVPSLG